MSDLNKIKDRVRKLLNLAADDGAADGEIDNALRAARELMLAHQLSDDDVSSPPEDLRTPEEIAKATEYGKSRSWADSEKTPQWMDTLAVAVAEFMATVHAYRNHLDRHVLPSGIVKHDGRPVRSWTFYGPADDAAFAAELHQELILTAATAAKLKWGGGLMKGDARDYCDGFASGLYEKVMDAKQAVEQESRQPVRIEGTQSTALSVVRATDIIAAKQQQATAWLKDSGGPDFTNRRKRYYSGSSRSVRDYGAYEAGKADGRSQSLARNRVARIG